jgi:hypothetical protein
MPIPEIQFNDRVYTLFLSWLISANYSEIQIEQSFSELLDFFIRRIGLTEK